MRLLFFSPFCGRTGSELALFSLIRNADRTRIEMSLACGSRGALSTMFPPDVQVFNYWHALSFADRALRKDSRGVWLADRLFNGIIRLIHQRVRPDAWYLNTIAQPNVLALARQLGVPCILHTHELEFGLSLLKPKDIKELISYPKLIIAASQCAAEMFYALGRRENIEVCYEPIDVNEIKSDSEQSLAIRRALNIPPEAFVWAMSGVRDIRKDPVTFVRIAAEILKSEPEARFMWLGGRDTGNSVFAEALAKSLAADSNIVWIPERAEDYVDYLNVADGFVLTSSDDTFPIVILEAAALGKPVVSFNSGGAKEFIRDRMGVLVDSWNVSDIAKAMLKVMRGDIQVDAGVSRVRASEFDVSIIVKHWEGLIHKYLL